MVKQHGLIRVFWPLDAVQRGISGVLVGWQNSPSDLMLISILENAEVESVEKALQSELLLRGSQYPLNRIWERCGRLPLKVVGVINSSPSVLASSATPNLCLYMHSTSRWPSVDRSLLDGNNIQLIFFKRPHPVQMQFMSLGPISLALTQESEIFGLHEPRLTELDATEDAETRRVQSLVRKLRQHTVIKVALNDKESVLPVIVNQINCCFEINALVQKNASSVSRKTRRSLSVSQRVSDSAEDLWDYAHSYIVQPCMDYMYPFARKLTILILMVMRVAAEVVLTIVEWKMQPQQRALRDVSATALQVDLRLQQLCYWPIQYQTLRKRRQNWRSITDHHTEYIRFFNSIWLVANDVIIGMAVGSFIMYNADILAQHFEQMIEIWSTTGLDQRISWLARNPGGLKLNDELAQFLGSLFSWIINYWAGCIYALKPLFPSMIRLVGLASACGATMPIAISSDIVSLFTIHIHCFYLSSARIYHLQLTTIISLFHLFRGKKRNVLRNRIDSCDYELDQLLLGTVMFTVLTFLLPTVLVFYSTFAFARTVIIMLKAFLDTLLAALNHFPLFALMLRIKDSKRLPRGIRFELRDIPPSTTNSDDSKSGSVAHILLKPIPLSIGAILQEYFRFGSRIQKHYLSADVLFRVATGRYVPPLPRRNLYGLQYSMLPAQRVSIGDLWNRLNADDAEDSSRRREAQQRGGNNPTPREKDRRPNLNGATL